MNYDVKVSPSQAIWLPALAFSERFSPFAGRFDDILNGLSQLEKA